VDGVGAIRMTDLDKVPAGVHEIMP
jgi:hypothetical protein